MLKWYESSGCSRFVPQSTLVEFMRWGKGKTQLGLLQMRLSEYLSLHRMSETAFAKHIGLSQAAVNRYCKGRVPAPEALKAIIRATGGAVTANDFFAPTSEINSHPNSPFQPLAHEKDRTP